MAGPTRNTHLPAGLNAGLFLRWSGAQAEMAAFAAVPDAQKYTRLHQFVVEAKAALLACPLVRLLPSVPLPAQPGYGTAFQVL